MSLKQEVFPFLILVCINRIIIFLLSLGNNIIYTRRVITFQSFHLGVSFLFRSLLFSAGAILITSYHLLNPDFHHTHLHPCLHHFQSFFIIRIIIIGFIIIKIITIRIISMSTNLSSSSSSSPFAQYYCFFLSLNFVFIFI